MNNKILIIAIIVFSLLLLGILLIVFVFNEDLEEVIPCPCDEDIMNCDDFISQAEAQVCFEYCGPEDVHRLDNDGDGVVCESLE